MALDLLHMEDVLWARQEVQRFLAPLSLSPADRGRLDVVTSELASNMVRHAHGGRLLIERLAQAARQGIRLTATDQGPGIKDVPSAMTAGFSTKGSLGDGLATVHELMDTFTLTTKVGEGTRIEVEKWLR